MQCLILLIQRALEASRTVKKTLIPHQGQGSDIVDEPTNSDSTLIIEVSPSEGVLIQQVSELSLGLALSSLRGQSRSHSN